MHKKKSREYLDKINQAFDKLTEPAHEIDLDSLLGYVRIFYSSVKSIPVDQSLNPDKSSEETIEFIPEMNEDKDSDNSTDDNVKNEAEDSPVENIITSEPETFQSYEQNTVSETNIEGIKESDEVHEVSDTSKEETEEENFKDEKIEDHTIYSSDENKKIEDEVEVIVESMTAESAPTEAQQEVALQNEAPKTIIPTAEAREIEQQHEAAIMRETEEVAVEVKPLLIPETDAQLTYSDPKPIKDNILSQIEQVQKPLYTPDNQIIHNPSDAIESLFKEKSPTGLVDFLGLSPLDNLSKAWGLNEKMLVIKDLFNDDFNAFNETVEMVNKFTSFDEVKSYLINNVINRFQWNDISKFKKASDFIVQTKRLFVK